MPTFTYKAQTTQGATVNGTLTAENQAAALRQLDERALFPVHLKEGGQAARTVIPGMRKKVRAGVIAAFYGQFSDLLRAGVPVLRSLDLLSQQSSHPLLSEILREVREGVSKGEPLADAMEAHPAAFSSLHTAMIRAGERGGFLEEVLSRIAIFTEKQNELRSKMLGSMIYPIILLTAGTGVVLFVMTFVVPKIRPFLESGGRKLPTLTVVVFAICDLITKYGWLLLLGAVLVGLVAGPWLRSPRGALTADRVKLRLPILGKILRMVSVCQFCRILGTLLRSGVPILQALRISQDSVANRVITSEIERATESVRQGETLAGPLAEGAEFPRDIVDMIGIAEESNSLDTVLVQIADTNEVRTARNIEIAVRILEPVLLMAMAGMVLIIALALLVPILSMSQHAL